MSAPSFEALLLQLTLLRTEGKTTNLSGTTKGGEPDYILLRRLEEREDPAFWRKWMSEQRTEDGRAQVVQELFELVTRLRYAPPPEERRGTKEWRQKVAADPRSLRVVAALYKVSHQTVANYRKEHRRAA